ncbi:hypothetical protein F4859DRAFT_524576 [Xylaria cf. heliscus]|nr:hypothetical protein F4859DRAFT_524576 [Xylaria cf. heliscus]
MLAIPEMIAAVLSIFTITNAVPSVTAPPAALQDNPPLADGIVIPLNLDRIRCSRPYRGKWRMGEGPTQEKAWTYGIAMIESARAFFLESGLLGWKGSQLCLEGEGTLGIALESWLRWTRTRIGAVTTSETAKPDPSVTGLVKAASHMSISDDEDDDVKKPRTPSRTVGEQIRAATHIISDDDDEKPRKSATAEGSTHEPHLQTMTASPISLASSDGDDRTTAPTSRRGDAMRHHQGHGQQRGGHS